MKNFIKVVKKFNNFVTFFVFSLILGISLLVLSELSKPKEPMSYIELSIKYKNCRVLKKYTKHDRYYLILINPVSENEVTVPVRDYVYMKVYFINDIIK